MKAIKDLISLNIFVISLVILYKTTDHLLALLIVITIVVLYMIKQLKLNNYVKRVLTSQVNILDTLFNSSSDIIIYQDLNNKIIACNNALCESLNIPKEEIIGHNFRYLFKRKVKCAERYKKLWGGMESKINQAIKTKQSVQFSEKFYADDGSEKYFNILISPASTANRELSGTILIARNVTSEQHAAHEASEKGKQLRCLLENLPIIAFMKDKNDKFVIGSSCFEKIINHENDDVKQLSLSDVFSKEYLEFIKREEIELYKTKQTIEIERQIVFPGQTFWGRIRKAPVFDEDGNIKYMISMYENIESEKEIERQKEYFIETLIHNLKIPTIAQLRGLELMSTGVLGTLTEEQKELVTQIQDSCKHILDMISMVLNTYRLESGQNHLYYERFSVAELLISCFEDLSSAAKEKNITLVYAASQDDTTVEADPAEIKKVITNLLDNAIIYSNRDEQIVVDITTQNNQLKCTITSCGITLSERDCLTAFNRLGSNAPKYTTIGHGIGLYLCKKIIDVHHGKIFASTDGEKTTTFTFIIPQYNPERTPKVASPLFI